MLAHKQILFERIVGTRIVAIPGALDAINIPAGAVAMRFAPDELYLTFALGVALSDAILAVDPHAIIIAEGAFSGARVEEGHALALLERLAEWQMPSERPAFVQGSVAGIATKLWFEAGRVLFVVQTPYAHELEERLER